MTLERQTRGEGRNTGGVPSLTPRFRRHAPAGVPDELEGIEELSDVRAGQAGIRPPCKDFVQAIVDDNHAATDVPLRLGALDLELLAGGALHESAGQGIFVKPLLNGSWLRRGSSCRRE